MKRKPWNRKLPPQIAGTRLLALTPPPTFPNALSGIAGALRFSGVTAPSVPWMEHALKVSAPFSVPPTPETP